MAGLDWSQCPAVESVPGKFSGAWVLKGTRMPVSAIFENIEAGANIDDIMEWFEGLDRKQVQAVIEFAARSLDRALAYADRKIAVIVVGHQQWPHVRPHIQRVVDAVNAATPRSFAEVDIPYPK
jgi:uncharacterized protein (DUF433 family)